MGRNFEFELKANIHNLQRKKVQLKSKGLWIRNYCKICIPTRKKPRQKGAGSPCNKMVFSEKAGKKPGSAP
jgi:hypothetical protein